MQSARQASEGWGFVEILVPAFRLVNLSRFAPRLPSLSTERAGPLHAGHRGQPARRPTEDATPENLLAGKYDAEAGRPLKEMRLELPPGSMVYINARIFHAVEAKPADSPQPYRIFNIDIFKEAGPPHRYTREIPTEWTARASPARRKLFMREAFTEGCWDQA